MTKYSNYKQLRSTLKQEKISSKPWYYRLDILVTANWTHVNYKDSSQDDGGYEDHFQNNLNFDKICTALCLCKVVLRPTFSESGDITS